MNVLVVQTGDGDRSLEILDKRVRWTLATQKTRSTYSGISLSRSARVQNQGRDPPTRMANSKKLPVYRRSASRGTSDAGLSTISSTIETIFSRTTFFDGHSVTSIAESQEPYHINIIPPPEPPIPLVLGSSFLCPYCRVEIIVGEQVTTNEDWIKHVYLDLEPYLCTYDTCVLAAKTFGVREDWFHHELECHRLQRVWFCRNISCTQEFKTKELFEQHLKSNHKDLFASSQLPFLIDNCERYSQKPLPKQTCPLCRATCSDVHSLKQHLGVHLEQLALTAIHNEDASEGDDVSEGETAPPQASQTEFLVKEFVEEQFGYYWPESKDETKGGVEAKAPPLSPGLQLAKGNSDRKSSIKSCSSDTSDLVNDPETKKSKKDKGGLWAHKVEAFLSKQTMGDTVAARKATSPMIRSNTTPPRNENFVGRAKDLDRIQEFLSPLGHICVLSGCGGVGKTTTAIEYSYRYENDYAYVLWVEAETSSGCADAYSLIASLLDLGKDIIHDQDGLTILVREFLQSTDKRWLIVFDNVEDWSEISQYIPRNLPKTRGSVLITTRRADLLRPTLSGNYHPLDIEPLTLEESTQLLLCSMHPDLSSDKMHSHSEYALAAEASELVERLPLGISMIAGYVQVSRCTLSEFIDIWNERQSRSAKRTDKIDFDTSQPSPNLAIDALWDIGIRELPMAARNLLDILSFLDPEGIDKELLIGDHTEPFLEFLNSSETIRYDSIGDVHNCKYANSLRQI